MTDLNLVTLFFITSCNIYALPAYRAVEENPRQNDFCRAENLRPLPHFSILLSSSLHHLLRTSR